MRRHQESNLFSRGALQIVENVCEGRLGGGAVAGIKKQNKKSRKKKCKEGRTSAGVCVLLHGGVYKPRAGRTTTPHAISKWNDHTLGVPLIILYNPATPLVDFNSLSPARKDI